MSPSATGAATVTVQVDPTLKDLLTAEGQPLDLAALLRACAAGFDDPDRALERRLGVVLTDLQVRTGLPREKILTELVGLAEYIRDVSLPRFGQPPKQAPPMPRDVDGKELARARTDAELFPEALRLSAEHRQVHGRGISGDKLAAALHVSKSRALVLLRQVRVIPRVPAQRSSSSRRAPQSRVLSDEQLLQKLDALIRAGVLPEDPPVRRLPAALQIGFPRAQNILARYRASRPPIT